jgi:hypothetical protein
MASIAIRTEMLGKQYRIGSAPTRPQNLRKASPQTVRSHVGEGAADASR